MEEVLKLATCLEFGEDRKLRRHLPPGKGPYSVGIFDFMSDHNENGSFFRLFYPTKKTDIYVRDKQWPLWLPRKQYGIGYAYFLGRNRKIFGKLLNWMGGDVHVPALWQGEIESSETRFPVIVLSHGIGGNRTTYTTLCLELASQGFIIASVEHRDGSASMTLCLKDSFRQHHQSHHQHHHQLHHRNSFNEVWKIYDRPKDVQWDDFDYRNKQVYQRAQECSKMLDILHSINEGTPLFNALGTTVNLSQFKDTMDLDNASIIGHSFGGTTCVALLAADKRFKVGVVLDGWMHPLDNRVYMQVTQPILMMNTETFQWKKNIQQMKQLDHPNIERLMLTIRGTCHQSVSDFQFLVNKPMGRFLSLRHTLAPETAMDIFRSGTLGFLWRHLDCARPSSTCAADFDDILTGKREHVKMGTNLEID